VEIDLLQDEYFREIIYRYRDEAMEKGLEKGLAKGRAEVVREQLNERFGPLPQWATDRLESATRDELKRLTSRVLKAETLAGVFD
jgi:hypothetical protein